MSQIFLLLENITSKPSHHLFILILIHYKTKFFYPLRMLIKINLLSIFPFWQAKNSLLKILFDF